MGATSSKVAVSQATHSTKELTKLEQAQVLLLQARDEAKLEHWEIAERFYRQGISSLEEAQDAAENKEHIKKLLAQSCLALGDVYRELNHRKAALTQYRKAQALGDENAAQRLKLVVGKEEAKVDDPLLDLLEPDKEGHYPNIFRSNPAFSCKESKSSDESKTTAQLAQRLNDPDLDKTTSAHYRTLAWRVLQAFAKEPVKTPALVLEVSALAISNNIDIVLGLLEQLITPIRDGVFLHPILLDALANVLKLANPAFLNVGDLETILRVLKDRFEQLSAQNKDKLLPLLSALSRLLDAMVDCEVKGLSRLQVHTPLYECLQLYLKDPDKRVAYQAAYTCQALLRIPNDETRLQSVLRHTLAVGKGVAGLLSAVQRLNIQQLEEAFNHFKEAGRGIASGVSHLQEAGSALTAAGKSVINATKEVKAAQISTAGDRLKEAKTTAAKQNSWYDELRFAELLLTAQNFVGFEHFIKNTANRMHAGFVLGMVRLLREIIFHHTDLNVREGALTLLTQCFLGARNWQEKGFLSKAQDKLTSLSRHTFFGRVVKENTFWGQHQYLQIEILRLLGEIATRTDNPVQMTAKILLLRLQQTEDEEQQQLLRREIPALELLSARREAVTSPSTQLMDTALQLPQKRVEEKLASVDQKLDISEQVRILLDQQRQSVLTDGNTNKELVLYIPSQAKSSVDDKDSFDLETEFHKFLSVDRTVFLLLGSSGAGKTSFFCFLEQKLWRTYRAGDPIPFFIPLTSVRDPSKDLIEQYLQKKGFSPGQVAYLKKNYRFIFLIDGVDEIRSRNNLIMSNRLLEWHAKIAVGCRTEYLTQERNYRLWFLPFVSERPQYTALQECSIVQFSPAQIKSYIEKYVVAYHPAWAASRYQIYLNKFPGLSQLVEAPFLLFILMSVLPDLVDKYGEEKDFSQLTRAALYEAFLEQWFERQIGKLAEQSRLDILGRNPSAALRDYAQRFAMMMVKAGVSVVGYQAEEKTTDISQPINPLSAAKKIGGTLQWLTNFQPNWGLFFQEDERSLTLRLACPIVREGENRYRFIHDSLREYLAAREQFDEVSRNVRLVKPPRVAAAIPTPSSPSERDEKKSDGETKAAVTAEAKALTHHTVLVAGLNLNAKLLKDSPALIRFHADMVKDHPDYEQILWGLLERSKENSEIAIAASNAITILCAARVSFAKHRDLRKVNIPGALLCEWVGDEIDLSDANIKDVHFHASWLRKVKFDGAEMEGVQFGELPYLVLKELKGGWSYSPDGRLFAIAEGNNIIIFNTQTWERVQELKGHADQVTGIAFDPHCPVQLASGSIDKNIRIWNVISGETLHILRREKDCLGWIAYDPHQANHLAVATFADYRDFGTTDDSPLENKRQSILILDIVKQKIIHDLKTGEDYILHLSYDPHHKNRLAFIGRRSRKTHIWDFSTELMFLGEELGEQNKAKCLIYDPHKKDFLAVGYIDGSIQIWDLNTKKICFTLEGHLGPVTALSFHPHQANRIVSGGHDKTIRIWDVQSRKPIIALRGHSDIINFLQYDLLQQDCLFSGGDDKSVRLWNVNAERTSYTSNEHPATISCLAIDPHNSECFASADRRGNVVIRDTVTGKILFTRRGSSGHNVEDLAYDPHHRNRLAFIDGQEVHILEAPTKNIVQTYKKEEKYFACMSYDPHQPDYIALVRRMDADTEVGPDIEILDLTNGKVVNTLSPGKDLEITQLAFDPHKKGYLGWISRFGSVHVTDIVGEKRQYIKAKQVLYCLTYDPHLPNRLALGCGDYNFSREGSGSVQIWDIFAKRVISILNDGMERVRCLAYHPQQKDCLASGSQDKKVRVWNLVDGSCIGILDLPQIPSAVIWCENGIIVGAGEGIYCFDVIRSEKILTFQLRWLNGPPTLWLDGVSIQGAKGLDPVTIKLLKQRGAIGEPFEAKEDEKASAITAPSERAITESAKAAAPLSLFFDPVLEAAVTVATKPEIPAVSAEIKDITAHTNSQAQVKRQEPQASLAQVPVLQVT